MSDEIKIQVGSSLADDLSAFTAAWKRAEKGSTKQERILNFESWEGLSSVLTTERYRLLRHLHAHPERSINALALSLKRQYRRVHDDVTALEQAGLVSRLAGDVRATADKLSAIVVL